MKEEMWSARDKDKNLFLYIGVVPPKKQGDEWVCQDLLKSGVVPLDKSLFPEVKWSDKEPTKVKLVIDK